MSSSGRKRSRKSKLETLKDLDEEESIQESDMQLMLQSQPKVKVERLDEEPPAESSKRPSLEFSIKVEVEELFEDEFIFTENYLEYNNEEPSTSDWTIQNYNETVAEAEDDSQGSSNASPETTRRSPDTYTIQCPESSDDSDITELNVQSPNNMKVTEETPEQVVIEEIPEPEIIDKTKKLQKLKLIPNLKLLEDSKQLKQYKIIDLNAINTQTLSLPIKNGIFKPIRIPHGKLKLLSSKVFDKQNKNNSPTSGTTSNIKQLTILNKIQVQSLANTQTPATVNDVASNKPVEQSIDPTIPVQLPQILTVQGNYDVLKPGTSLLKPNKYTKNRRRPIKTADQFTVDINLVFEHIDAIKKKNNPIDNAICILITNAWGKIVRKAQEFTFINGLFSTVLNRWVVWHKGSPYRDCPLIYKCFICKKGWWDLDPFRTHISQHPPTFLLSLEEYSHECCVLAHIGELPAKKDVPVEGDCRRCGRDYSWHGVSINMGVKIYKCSECSCKFFTCASLRLHENDHISKELAVKCELCDLVFTSTESLNDHLVLSHTVRSDVPVLTKYKYCNLCSEKYSVFSLHLCLKRGTKIKCKFCYQRFSSQALSQIHSLCSTENVDCEFCDAVLPADCSVMEHLNKEHSDSFAMVYKCLLCKDPVFFVNDNIACTHTTLMHKVKIDKRWLFSEMVILPKTVLHHITPLPNSISSAINANKKPKTYKLLPKPPMPIKKEIILDQPAEDILPNPQQQTLLTPQTEEATQNINITVKREIDDEPETIIIKQEPVDLEYEVYDEITIKEEIPDEVNSMDITFQYETETTAADIDLTKSDNRKIHRCKECCFEGNIRQFRLHLSTMKCMKTYKKDSTELRCTKCDTNFTSLAKYLIHFGDHGLKPRTCPDCLVYFDDIYKLVGHFRMTVRQNYVTVKYINTMECVTKPSARTNIYQCKVCKRSVEIKDFFEHWEAHFDLMEKFQKDSTDDDEDKTMPFVEDALEPELLKDTLEFILLPRFHEGKYQKVCTVCNRQFERRNDCKRHIIEHLLTDATARRYETGLLQCQICRAEHGRVDRYKDHMREHASLPIYKCKLCDRCFSDSSNFTKHKKVHNTQALTCNLCKKKFQLPAMLQKHLEMHANTSVVECPKCDRRFFGDTDMKKHYRSTHELSKCVRCNITFNTLKAKWDHLWDVHKERKFIADCPVCNMQFRKFNDVKSHVKNLHNMEITSLNFKCPENDRFRQRDRLKIAAMKRLQAKE